MSNPGTPFAKGHGTGNDFIVLPDLRGELDLSDAMVQGLCDRRTGIGGDGVLRMVATSATDDPDARGADIFMDYRNADGSLAQMCGNGIRVFAAWMFAHGLADPEGVDIATRGGVRRVRRLPDGDYEVRMGHATPVHGTVSVTLGAMTFPGVGVLVPNPHAVVFVGSLDAAGSLAQPPRLSPGTYFPEGANVEVVHEVGPAHVAMRVHERGVGETMSCGTGACAVAWASRRRPGASDEDTYRVDVPGGHLRVHEAADGELSLIGPAVLVGEGVLDAGWVSQWS